MAQGVGCIDTVFLCRKKDRQHGKTTVCVLPVVVQFDLTDLKYSSTNCL